MMSAGRINTKENKNILSHSPSGYKKRSGHKNRYGPEKEGT